MRQLGSLPNREEAEKFADYLLTEGIRTRLDDVDDGEWTIWILSEDDLDRGRDAFEHFRQHPGDPRYLERSESAAKIRDQRKNQILRAKKNLQPIRFSGPAGRENFSDRAKRLPITIGMIVICALVAFYTGLGGNEEKTAPLMFVSQQHRFDEGWDHTDPTDAMVDVRAGQVWRLVTPAFVHLGAFHLIFNMLWLNMLGGQIETRKGKLTLLLMVLALALFSNLLQVFVWRYPFFGGMSGVVYGLFGYIWIKSRLDPLEGFQISQQNVILMLVWFFICFIPGFGVANGAHAGGLILGAIMGFVSSKLK